MDYSDRWKVLERLMAELRRRQINVPKEIMTSLKTAKTMISISEVDPKYSESILSIEDHLLTVESRLFELAETLGHDFAETWTKKFEKAQRRRRSQKKEAVNALPFRSLPKGTHWIRIKLSSEILEEKVKALASQSDLSCELQKDGRMVVYGGKAEVQDFVKKMAEEQRRKR